MRHDNDSTKIQQTFLEVEGLGGIVRVIFQSIVHKIAKFN